MYRGQCVRSSRPRPASIAGIRCSSQPSPSRSWPLRSGRACCHRLRSAAAQRGERRHVLAAAAPDDVLDHSIDLGAARARRCRDRRGATPSSRRRRHARAPGTASRCGGRRHVLDRHRAWLRRANRSRGPPCFAMGSRRASCGARGRKLAGRPAQQPAFDRDALLAHLWLASSHGDLGSRAAARGSCTSVGQQLGPRLGDCWNRDGHNHRLFCRAHLGVALLRSSGEAEGRRASRASRAGIPTPARPRRVSSRSARARRPDFYGVPNEARPPSLPLSAPPFFRQRLAAWK
jgi:hypothetical protein